MFDGDKWLLLGRGSGLTDKCILSSIQNICYLREKIIFDSDQWWSLGRGLTDK